MRLYEDFHPDRVDVFQNGLIGLSKLRSFNDPFDGSPNISGITDPIQMARVTNERTKKHVVFCLSESPNNPLMWGHYAASLTGFVIGFDSTKEIISTESPSRRLSKVGYTRVRPTRPSIDDFTEEELFFTKAEDWSYEREWRILDHQDFATSGAPSKEAYDTRMFRFDPAAIVEVICGWRGARARETIQNILRRDEFKHVLLMNAQPDLRLYDIKLCELPRTHWEYWYLDTLPGVPGGRSTRRTIRSRNIAGC